MGSPIERRIFKEGCVSRVRGGSWRINDVPKVEIRQVGFGHCRVSYVKEVGKCVEILLECKMDQPNC